MLSAERDRYEPADSVTLRLANGTPSEIGYNLCFAKLERRDGPAWTPHRGCVHYTSEYERSQEMPLCDVCEAVQYRMRPSGKDRYTFRLTESLPAGVYRFRLSIEVDTLDSSVETDPFVVGGSAG